MRSSSSAISSSRLRPVTSNTSSATRLMMSRAWIVIFIDAMPESHEFAFAVFHALDKFRNVARLADVREHLEHLFIRAAVQRSV